MTTNLSNLKIIWEQFKIVVSSTSTLPLPQQASFDSNVFQNVLFSYKMICFYFSLLNYIIKLNIAIFYQIFYNCSCNPVFVVADLRKKHDLKMTRWQLLGSIFSSVYFSENFTTPVVFFLFRSILLFTGQFFYQNLPKWIRVLWKSEYI